MSKVLSACKEVLARRSHNDTNSIREVVKQVAERLKVRLSDKQIDMAVVYLRHGRSVW